MVYVLTVHFADSRWIDLQASFLSRFLKCDYKVYALLINCRLKINIKNYIFFNKKINLDTIDGISLNHAKNMEFLLKKVLKKTNDNDVLIFLDGDAFPVREIGSYIKEKLLKFPLIAIQRIENAGDIQPHPSFCATTVAFWKKIKGDWRPGYFWKDIKGMDVTDSGGVLLKKLNDGGYKWFKLKRTNKLNLHPLFFGVYDDFIYHHGAGFRKPLSRYDLKNSKLLFFSECLRKMQKKYGSVFFLYGMSANIFEYLFYIKNAFLSAIVFKMIAIKNILYKLFVD